MGPGALIDTNVVSDYFKGSMPLPGYEYVRGLIIAEANISVMTQIELLAWNVGSSLQAMIEVLIDNSHVFSLEYDIIVGAANIRKVHRLKMPDVVIAATAVAYEMTLVTRNLKDFRKVPGLNLLNPWDIYAS